MASLVRKSTDSPDETRPFKDGMGRMDIVNLQSGRLDGRGSSRDGNGRSTSNPSLVPTAARSRMPAMCYRGA